MYVKIRKVTAKPGDSDVIVNISKMAPIQELRGIIFHQLKVEVGKQRLFYKGKQLVDDHRIMDYDIQLNDVIQLLIKNKTPELLAPSVEKSRNEDESAAASSNAVEEKTTSEYFKIGDAVDYIDVGYGAWFEAHIVDILQATDKENVLLDIQNKEADIIFRIQPDADSQSNAIDVPFNIIRPRSYYIFKTVELLVDNIVLVNYNIEQPTARGYWYDFVIKEITRKTLKGTILVGRDRTELENCTVKLADGDVLRIEKSILLSHRAAQPKSFPPLRKSVYNCEKCQDVATKPCKECGCKVCAGKNEADTIILCDECDDGYHIKCLTSPLSELPSEPEWYCPSCKLDENEIVKAGDKLKFSNKKAKMASTKQEDSARDWGRGMACVGRTKECTIVPKNHYGSVPGIEVGTCWKFRLQVSEAGIHRPHVAGIHGRETDGAYSLVLSGGYEDDVDNGEEFIYTGSGGRDLSGNKRTSDQSCDQALTRMNKALALNCNVPLNKNGAEATDWRSGKPVRVVRNYKATKHSTYAPKDGNRYDGLYKVVKYYPEKGKSGYLVWKYVLRRDDPTPTPWSEDGQELEMIYPPGFLEAQSLKEKASVGGVKRDASPTLELKEFKKKKVELFELTEEIEQAVTNDHSNEKLWNECKKVLKEGKKAFLDKVEAMFMCICCQEVVYQPITTECKHNMCKYCLKRSFSAEIYNCPHCRFELGSDLKMTVNMYLSSALLALFPGYEADRRY